MVQMVRKLSGDPQLPLLGCPFRPGDIFSVRSSGLSLSLSSLSLSFSMSLHLSLSLSLLLVTPPPHFLFLSLSAPLPRRHRHWTASAVLCVETSGRPGTSAASGVRDIGAASIWHANQESGVEVDYGMIV